MDYKNLIKEAFIARKSSYAPYSKFNVGAALLTKDGSIIRGCNIENATYSPSCCGERTAFFKAISDNKMDFKAMAIVGGLEDAREGDFDYCPPCGVCRQVMVEFCDLEDFDIVLAKSEEDYRVYKLKDLLPQSFSSKDLKKK